MAEPTNSFPSRPPPEIPVRLFKWGPFPPNSEKAIKNTRSNHYIVVENLIQSAVVVTLNQKLYKAVVTNASNSSFQILDSAVIGTKTVEFLNVRSTDILFDEVDVRTLNFYNAKNCTIQFTAEPTLLENVTINWHGNCSGNRLQRVRIQPGTDPNQFVKLPTEVILSFSIEASTEPHQTHFMDGLAPMTSRVPSETQSRSEQDVLAEIEEISGRPLDASLDWGALYDEELREFEDPEEILLEKVKIVADALRAAKHSVIYTGAGISTSAKIPDYRGPQGIWTARARGELPEGKMQLSQAFPTYGHYAVTQLLRQNLIKFVTSTNLDGLHRRSGTREEEIAELHGNCFREICGTCEKEFLRGFDTLASRHDRWSHITGRLCTCGGKLKDTVVHFTENMPVKIMERATLEARTSDLSLVLGTSMNVQPAASLPEKSLRNSNGKLFIVNLQRTPFDDVATLKIYSKTDNFLKLLMRELDIDNFDTSFDDLEILRATQEREEDIPKFQVEKQVEVESVKESSQVSPSVLAGVVVVGFAIALGMTYYRNS